MGERSLAEWLGEADEGGAEDGGGRSPRPEEPSWNDRPGRSARLWVLAVVPWVVIAVGVVVLVRPGTPGEPPAPTGEDAPHGAVDGDPGAAHAGADPDQAAADAPLGEPDPALPPAGGELPAPGGEQAAQPGTPDASGADPPPLASLPPRQHRGDAVALAAVHLQLTGTSEEGVERYVELATIEEVTPLTHDTAVVTVLAVVLDGADGTWTGRRAARYAVPVRTVNGDPIFVGAPWPLPAPHLDDAARPDGEADEDPTTGAAVAAALAAAGYADAEVGAVTRLGPGLLRAEVTAVPPGETAPRALEPWLTDQPTPRLLGGGPAEPQPEPTPPDPGGPTDAP